MKLSEYLHNKMGPPHAITWRSRRVEQIEEWIVEWYRSEFTEVGCDGPLAEPLCDSCSKSYLLLAVSTEHYNDDDEADRFAFA